ncbi:MAG: PrgI family protein [Clostridiaceae bacterium]|nr:PrgI family protein [Clostridiaceae bacterium]
MEVRINKEVRNYQESLFFGLTLRQFLCSLLAVFAALGTYFALQSALGMQAVGWACVLAAFPFALCGFFSYNGMTAEQFVLAVFRTEVCYPKQLRFQSSNLYAQAMKDSSLREVLKLD